MQWFIGLSTTQKVSLWKFLACISFLPERPRSCCAFARVSTRFLQIQWTLSSWNPQPWEHLASQLVPPSSSQLSIVLSHSNEVYFHPWLGILLFLATITAVILQYIIDYHHWVTLSNPWRVFCTSFPAAVWSSANTSGMPVCTRTLTMSHNSQDLKPKLKPKLCGNNQWFWIACQLCLTGGPLQQHLKLQLASTWLGPAGCSA